MVDLMTVEWRRPNQRGADEPFNFWFAADLFDQLDFAHTWADDPRAHFAKFSGASTIKVLEILTAIAEHRSNIMVQGWRPNSSTGQVVPAMYDDTLDVVKYSPRHCGGWLGLLRIRMPNASARVVVVDRPSDSHQWFVTWPPSAGRGFLTILRWFMQNIRIEANAFDTGNSWVPSANMLAFMAGQKATGGPTSSAGAPTAGFESFSNTIRALVYENADQQLLAFYMRHLRGHGPTETGSVHHFNQMVSGSSEADASGIRSNIDVALHQDLLGFPAAWALTRSFGDWSGAIADHLQHWRVGMGNHRDGLTWLRNIVTARKTEWDRANILDVIGGTRSTQRTVGVTTATTLSQTDTVSREISTTISDAYRTATTEAWSRALTNASSRLDTIGTRTTTGSSSTHGMQYGNDTAVTVGGETGALEELLLGKITGEVTTTMKSQLSSQFTQHRALEEASSTATGTSTSTTDTTQLTRMRERTYTLTNSFRTAVSQAITTARTLSTSTSDVINLDGDASRQAASVRDGLDVALRAINDALSSL